MRTFLKFKLKKNYSQSFDFQKYPKALEHVKRFQIARGLFEKRDFLEARRIYDESVFNLSNELPSDHFVLAIAYNDLAECLRKCDLSKFQSARFNNVVELFEKSISIMLLPANQDTFLEQIGTLYNNYGNQMVVKIRIVFFFIHLDFFLKKVIFRLLLRNF